MPIKDINKNRDYQREWAKKTRAAESPIERELRLERRRILRSTPKAKAAALKWERANAKKVAARKQRATFEKDYGVFAECARLNIILAKLLGRTR